MKHIILFLFICICQTGYTQIRFSQTECNLGIVPEDTVHLPQCTFHFTNVGKKAVSIAKIIPSCGCIKVKFNTEPITEGKSGIISATFDPYGRSGLIMKTIRVYFSNYPQPYVLKLKGSVKKGKSPPPKYWNK